MTRDGTARYADWDACARQRRTFVIDPFKLVLAQLQDLAHHLVEAVNGLDALDVVRHDQGLRLVCLETPKHLTQPAHAAVKAVTSGRGADVEATAADSATEEDQEDVT